MPLRLGIGGVGRHLEPDARKILRCPAPWRGQPSRSGHHQVCHGPVARLQGVPGSIRGKNYQPRSFSTRRTFMTLTAETLLGGLRSLVAVMKQTIRVIVKFKILFCRRHYPSISLKKFKSKFVINFFYYLLSFFSSFHHCKAQLNYSFSRSIHGLGVRAVAGRPRGSGFNSSSP